jgi:hypothetical protein
MLPPPQTKFRNGNRDSDNYPETGVGRDLEG